MTEKGENMRKTTIICLLAALLLCGCADGDGGEAQTTQTAPVTEAATEAPSATEPSTEPETEAEAPTETEPQTEAPTETEPETEAPPHTEAPAWTAPPVTEAPAPAWTEPPEPVTEAPEPVTEAPEPQNTVVGTSATGMTIENVGGVTYVGGILVANKTYSLPDTYYPGGLTAETASAFASLQSGAAADGLSIWCVSGFRSYWDQNYTYNYYVSFDGQANADTYSARPGHSEHQTGMALDVNSLYASFGDTAEGKWLAAHAWEYGFIIRYPADKTAITGYTYEPWHIRYVGKWAAAKMHETGQCLEEYLGIDSYYR